MEYWGIPPSEVASWSHSRRKSFFIMKDALEHQRELERKK